ncbi:MAG: hypothetical protein ACI4BD_07890 [Paludibacteraceae bacterium]
MKHKGAQVVTYPERPSNRTFQKVLLRLLKRFVPAYFCRYIQKVVSENVGADFDYILVVRGEGFSPKAVSILRRAYPKAQLIFYAWDVFASSNNSSWLIPYFDRFISFDYTDATKHNLIFRPLFYTEECMALSKQAELQYDCYMVGTISSRNRYDWMKFLHQYFEQRHMPHFFYPYIPSFPSYIRAKWKGIIPLTERRSHFHFKGISLLQIFDILANSRAVLDIPFEKQTDCLNMRPYEAMATNTKYITTIDTITRYNFYNPENIFVLSKGNVDELQSFIHKRYTPIPYAIREMYSIEAFVEDIFLIQKEDSYTKFFRQSPK